MQLRVVFEFVSGRNVCAYLRGVFAVLPPDTTKSAMCNNGCLPGAFDKRNGVIHHRSAIVFINRFLPCSRGCSLLAFLIT